VRRVRSGAVSGNCLCNNSKKAREAFLVFKRDPFDPRLRSHKIHKLSARYGRIVYAAEIEADLRVAFYITGDMVVTVDIGSHDVYRG
jgi:mRNA-degrading endonuclease YafQ of YafQ-DinJ toxin-antitoxin module